jgi:hypothetical protein
MSEWPAADDPRLGEVVEHLQGAAHELIAAARVLLDITDDLVDDPAALVAALGSLADVARSVASAGVGTAGADGQPGDDRVRGDRPPRAPRVQHIRIS